MLAIGCIQAQKCHANHCSTGVATQDKWLMRGLDPEDKSARVTNYILTLRKEILHLSHACGLPHPALVSSSQIETIPAPKRSSRSLATKPIGHCPRARIAQRSRR